MFSFKATENLLDSLLINTEPRYIRNGFLNFDRIKMETCHNTFTVKLCSGGITLAVAEVTPWAEADTVELVVHEGSIKIFLEDVPEQDDKKDIMNLSKIAREELKEERRRESINAYKEKLRNRKSFWHKIFPFTIRIEKEEMMAPTIIEQAKQELKEELMKDAKERLKIKMKQLHSAELIVSNIRRELADLELEISDKIDAL